MKRAMKIAISLPETNLRQIETIRKKNRKSRSSIIDEAISFWLNHLKQLELVKQYEEGYARIPEPDTPVTAYETAQIGVLRKEKW